MKQTNVFAASFVFILLQCFPLYAQNWTVIETQTKKNMFLTNLAGENELQAQVVSSHELGETEISLISSCLNAIWAIPGIIGTKTSVSISDDGLMRVIAYPQSLKYFETDLAANLPGGLGFYYNTALFYDVTLKVGEYIAKVTGLYTMPQDLLKRLSLACSMPDRFLYDDEILKRLGRLEKTVMALLKAYPIKEQLDPSLVIAIIGLYNENPAIKAKDAVKLLKESGIKATEKEINAVLQIMVGKF